MKLILPILLLAAAAALWQWRQLANLEQRESSLRTELSKLESTVAAAISTVAGKSSAAAEQTPPAFIATDFLAGVKALLAGSDKREARREWLEMFARLERATPQQIEELLAELARGDYPAEMKREFPMLLQMRLAESKPAAAADAALKSGQGPQFVMMLQSWMQRDAAGAGAWLEQALTDGRLTAGSFTGTPFAGEAGIARLRSLPLLAALKADPAGPAVDRLLALPPAIMDDLLEEAAKTLRPEQQAAIFQRLAAAPDLEVLKDYAGEIAARAATFAETQRLLTGANLTPMQFTAVAGQAVTSAPAAQMAEAVAWFLPQVPEEQRAEHLRRIVLRWTDKDYNGAATWLRAFPAGGDRDRAVAAFAPLVVATEPPSAVDWAITIAAPDQRTAALREIWTAWEEKSPGAAPAYFQSKGLAAPE